MTKFNIFVIIIKQFATRTVPYAQIAQLVEQRTENPRVLGSIPSLGMVFNMREWLSGRASPCQGEGREFESRFALCLC